MNLRSFARVCLVDAAQSCLVVMFGFVPASSAQTGSTGALTGTVTDPSGGVVVGATVTVTNLATGQVRTAPPRPTASGTYKLGLPLDSRKLFRQVHRERIQGRHRTFRDRATSRKLRCSTKSSMQIGGQAIAGSRSNRRSSRRSRLKTPRTAGWSRDRKSTSYRSSPATTRKSSLSHRARSATQPHRRPSATARRTSAPTVRAATRTTIRWTGRRSSTTSAARLPRKRQLPRHRDSEPGFEFKEFKGSDTRSTTPASGHATPAANVEVVTKSGTNSFPRRPLGIQPQQLFQRQRFLLQADRRGSSWTRRTQASADTWKQNTFGGTLGRSGH